MSIPKPVLKWVGGKTKLLPTILDILPKKIEAYYEPFAGGLGIFFALYRENRLKHRAILGDTNPELVITYNAIRNNPELVSKYLKEYSDEHHYRLKEEIEFAKEYYLRIRATPLEMLSNEGVAARMIYLNKTCFNGLYRVNKSGGFNVPFGKYANPKIFDHENLPAVSEALNAASIYKSDFEDLMRDAGNSKVQSVVYFDSPYIPLSATSNFTSYTVDGFDLIDQKRLVSCAKKLKEKGVFVLLSNSDTQITRELYKDFYLKEVKVGRSINSKGDKRGKVGELLICSEEI